MTMLEIATFSPHFDPEEDDCAEDRYPDGGTQFLRGERIYLRPLEVTDATAEYVRWLNDPEVTRYLEAGKYPATRESVRDYIRSFQGSRTSLAFAIIDRATGRHIGNVTLNHIDPIHRTADTGIMIGCKEFWGRGIAYEAWSLLIRYAFDRLNLRKIVAGAVVENRASIRTLEKLGFRIEGTFREEKWVDGRYVDTVRLGLFREEFRPK
ncbi:MAG: GNAT family protein [Chloroflexota bacterium]|nr:GNAT family N-acetyltransferase [Dehalococcoidia bacterium]MDW8254588.1 GNAT family protein [Chloroflexota bacterium]